MLELSIVMFLLTILLGFALPRFSLVFESNLLKSARKIAYILNDLKVQAVIKGENYKIVFDSTKSEYAVLTQNLNDLSFQPHPKYSEPITLEKKVQFSRIKRNEEKDENEFGTLSFKTIEFDKIFGSKYEFRINSSGLIELFTLKLKDENNYLYVSVVNIMGKIVIGEEKPL